MDDAAAAEANRRDAADVRRELDEASDGFRSPAVSLSHFLTAVSPDAYQSRGDTWWLDRNVGKLVAEVARRPAEVNARLASAAFHPCAYVRFCSVDVAEGARRELVQMGYQYGPDCACLLPPARTAWFAGARCSHGRDFTCAICAHLRTLPTILVDESGTTLGAVAKPESATRLATACAQVCECLATYPPHSRPAILEAAKEACATPGDAALRALYAAARAARKAPDPAAAALARCREGLDRPAKRVRFAEPEDSPADPFDHLSARHGPARRPEDPEEEWDRLALQATAEAELKEERERVAQAERELLEID